MSEPSTNADQGEPTSVAPSGAESIRLASTNVSLSASLQLTRLEAFAASPLAHTLIIANTLISGIIANKYFDEIIRSFIPRQRYFDDGFSPGTLCFVCLAAIIIWLSIFAQRASTKEQQFHRNRERAASDALLQNTAQLERTDQVILEEASRGTAMMRKLHELTNSSLEIETRLLRLTETLPPGTMLEEFAAADARVSDALIDFIYTLPSAGTDRGGLVRDAMRVILENVVRLASVFDEGSGRAKPLSHTYGCNYMQFIPWTTLTSLNEAQRRLVCSGLAYTEPAAKRCVEDSIAGTVSGALFLHHDLAVTFGADERPVFDTKHPLTLCVLEKARTARDDGTEVYQAPVGAVISFLTGKPFHVPSPEFAVEWVNGRCTLSDDPKNEVLAFHRDTTNGVRSYFCAPVVNQDSAEVLGIVNIHSSGTSLFEGRETEAHLYPLLLPLLNKLAEVAVFLVLPTPDELAAHAKQIW